MYRNFLQLLTFQKGAILKCHHFGVKLIKTQDLILGLPSPLLHFFTVPWPVKESPNQSRGCENRLTT